MKKARNSVLAVLSIMLFFLTAFSSVITEEKKYGDLLGEWDVQTESGQYSFVFTFSVENDTLKGIFSGSTGEVEMENLSYEDSKLTFTVNVDAGGQSMAIDFSCSIEGDVLEGMLSLQFGEANITGKKRK